MERKGHFLLYLQKPLYSFTSKVTLPLKIAVSWLDSLSTVLVSINECPPHLLTTFHHLNDRRAYMQKYLISFQLNALQNGLRSRDSVKEGTKMFKSCLTCLQEGNLGLGVNLSQVDLFTERNIKLSQYRLSLASMPQLFRRWIALSTG